MKNKKTKYTETAEQKERHDALMEVIIENIKLHFENKKLEMKVLRLNETIVAQAIKIMELENKLDSKQSSNPSSKKIQLTVCEA